jgi:hypothetical protein
MENHMRLTFLAIVAAASLAACSNNDNPINPPIGQLRVANAISDSTTVQSSVESVSANDTLDFGEASGERDLPDGNYLTHLTAHSDATATTHTFDSDVFNIDKNHVTTVFAVGKMADSSEDTFVVEASDNDISSSQSEAQFVDVAANQTGSVDIYVTAVGAALLPADKKATLAFKANNEPAIFTPGTYEIRVTPAGVPATILFDSGAIDFPLATTDQFVLIDHTADCAVSPYTLLVIVGSDGSHLVNDAGC